MGEQFMLTFKEAWGTTLLQNVSIICNILFQKSAVVVQSETKNSDGSTGQLAKKRVILVFI